MKNAKEMRAIAEAAQKTLEEDEIRAAQKYVDITIMPLIEDRAKAGYCSIRVKKVAEMTLQTKIDNILRANGYGVDFADNNERRITW